MDTSLFANSTQSKFWLFTESALRERKKMSSCVPIVTEEEEELVQFYLSQYLIEKASKVFDFRTVSTALMYLQRYLLCHGLRNLSVDELLGSCIFLASKTEEKHYPPTKICSAFNITPDVLSKGELQLISAINFHLVVWTPYDSFKGYIIYLVCDYLYFLFAFIVPILI